MTDSLSAPEFQLLFPTCIGGIREWGSPVARRTRSLDTRGMLGLERPGTAAPGRGRAPDRWDRAIVHRHAW